MAAKAASEWDVIVVGGGASGMMAAGRAAELGARVLVLEKNARLGEKLLITGGGRSNVTNHELDDRKLLAKFKKRSQFLFSPFSRFSVKETLDFFHARGMETKEEAEGRMFPKSEKAESVWEALVLYMKEGGVRVRSRAEVAGFKTKNNEIVGVTLKGGETLSARAYILATGGMSHPETGSTGDGFAWLAKLGHTVAIPTPSLVPIATKDAWSHALAGLSWKDAEVRVLQGKKMLDKRTGKILFTHVGLSGPLILNMSRNIGDLLNYGPVELSIDLFPKMDNGALDRELLAGLAKEQNRQLANALAKVIPSSLAKTVVPLLGFDGAKETNRFMKAERTKLVRFLKAVPLSVKRLLGTEKAVVVSGGLDLSEVETKHMRSLKYPNLYVVGDILDIDRPSGGYSLQLCWTTGWVAGTSAAQSIS